MLGTNKAYSHNVSLPFKPEMIKTLKHFVGIDIHIITQILRYSDHYKICGKIFLVFNNKDEIVIFFITS